MGLSSINNSAAFVQAVPSLPFLADKQANTSGQSSRGSEPNAHSTSQEAKGTAHASAQPESPAASQGRSSDSSSSQKDAEIIQEVNQLKARDTEVRAHELAHVAAGGPYVQGVPHYETVQGPDGHFYAVGGEVSIDVSSLPGDPRATIEKMETVKRAALAPAQPSPQDYRIASSAQTKATKAYQELMALAFQISTPGASREPRSSGASVNTVV